jgi:hypothetical protein
MSNDLIKLGPTESFSDVQLQGSRVKTLGKCKWEQAKQQAQLLAAVDLSIQNISILHAPCMVARKSQCPVVERNAADHASLISLLQTTSGTCTEHSSRVVAVDGSFLPIRVCAYTAFGTKIGLP